MTQPSLAPPLLKAPPLAAPATQTTIAGEHKEPAVKKPKLESTVGLIEATELKAETENQVNINENVLNEKERKEYLGSSKSLVQQAIKRGKPRIDETEVPITANSAMLTTNNRS